MSDMDFEISIVTTFTDSNVRVKLVVNPSGASFDDVILSLESVLVSRILDEYPDSSTKAVVGLVCGTVEMICDEGKKREG